jgi:hypothetical protein
MGCDYYIVKYLNIYYNDIDYLVVELERERGYYIFQYDEDFNDYDDKINEYIKDCLTPKMKPIIIYSNNSFNKVNSETKYKILIENEINNYGKKWCEITKIIKVEDRFERV